MMKRKSILFFILIVFILNIVTCTFATDNPINNIKSSISNVTSTVVDGTNNLVQDSRNAINSVGGTVENTAQNITDNTENAIKTGENTIESIGSTAYNATMTSTQDMVNGMTVDTWTWVFIVAGLAIVIGLIYYYTTQKREL